MSESLVNFLRGEWGRGYQGPMVVTERYCRCGACERVTMWLDLRCTECPPWEATPPAPPVARGISEAAIMAYNSAGWGLKDSLHMTPGEERGLRAFVEAELAARIEALPRADAGPRYPFVKIGDASVYLPALRTALLAPSDAPTHGGAR